MENPRRRLKKKYSQCRVHDNIIGCNEKRDMGFSRGRIEENGRYDMILGQDVWSKLILDLCFSEYTTKWNRGKYEGFMTPMKEVKKVHVKNPTEYLDDKNSGMNYYGKENTY